MKRLRKNTQPFLLGLRMRSGIFSFLKQAPFLRLLPGLIAGILLQYYFSHPLTIELSIILFLLLGITALRFLSVQQKYRLTVWVGSGIYILLICLGSIITHTYSVTSYKDWIGHDTNIHQPLLIRLIETPVERKKSFKTTATIEYKFEYGKWLPVKGKLLLYFSKEEKNGALKQGDRLLINQTLQPVDTNTNPGAFNYATYLSRNNIYHRLFLRASQYQQIDTSQTSRGSQTTQIVLSILRKYIPGKQEQAIAEALLIGYTFDLEDELLEAYSRTGVIHVIAISGMHLGLVYGLLLLLTSPLKKIRHIRWIRPVLLLVALWSFSLLVGAGASVLRAAVIFSFMILGEWLQRKNNPFNSLAASMFCLLCFNPFYLWDVGFQLSYAAVAGIMVFTRPIYRYWYIPNKVFRYCWQLLVVTCSAQVFTIPVVLYHFHQFPNLFMITNLVVVPLSGFILYGCILLLIVSPFSFIAQYLGKILQIVLQWMNRFIGYTEQLSFAVTDHIQINATQITCYFLLVFFLCRWIIIKKNRYAFYSLICICVGISLYAYRHIEIRQKKRLIVYHLPGNTVTEIFGAGKYISIGKQEQIEATHKMRLSTHTWMGGFKQKAFFVPNPYLVMSVNKFTAAWLSAVPSHKTGTAPIEVDVLILQNNPAVTIVSLQQLFRASLYVWDNNNPLWKIRKWKKEADSLHLRHHSVPEQGTLVMDF
ncbi:ComEC/Rec2 family competence protein [Sediminibacterium sp.]|uniref:ComEC/Rec2 family competence protein n=1 Tax=Sediminibacterium sp. TaxID=1917865 RepID=UPI0025DA585D|nr:ComEC/Rec2 family competence protein [Sediminibacterium sp.]MBW0178907.1 competence protein ComEC family protein [Sediminibacterium sp.]